MNDFFLTIYSWFCNEDLLSFKIMEVFGESEEGLPLISGNFGAIGLTALVISLLVAFAYYIWPINHPRFKSWWSWLIMLAANALINFGLTFAFISFRIKEVEGNQELMEWIPESDYSQLLNENNVIDIPFSDQLEFALSNVVICALFFIIASLIFTWYRGNCQYSPFRK